MTIPGKDNKTDRTQSLFPAIAARLPAPLIMITLWVLSSQSTLPEMKGILGFDKFLHFTAFAALSVASGLWFSRGSWLGRPGRNFLICLAVVFVYGALDEFHQYFVPGRASNIWDWVADIMGGAAGAAAALLAVRFWDMRPKGLSKAGCIY